jgi:NADPH2:quinone reductase
MRAAWYSKNGAAKDVLEVGELPTPEPGPGEVRVKVAVSGINPSDVKSRGGSRPVSAGFVVPHSDGAGTIDKVGAGVAAARIGQRVWIWNGQWNRTLGTAAEFICLAADQAVPLPDAVDFGAGACLGIPALTAMHAIELLGDLTGKTVLVIGAASSVGFYAAQMAKLKGARVLGTVGSPDKAAVLAPLGITDLIFYKQEAVAERVKALTSGRGVDAIVDMDFSTSTRLVNDGAVAPHGAVICYGSNARGEVPLTFSAWLPRSIDLRFFLVYDLLPAQRQAAVDQLSRWLAAGQLRHNLGPSFTLAEIAAAHEAVEGGGAPGNILVQISS